MRASGATPRWRCAQKVERTFSFQIPSVSTCQPVTLRTHSSHRVWYTQLSGEWKPVPLPLPSPTHAGTAHDKPYVLMSGLRFFASAMSHVS